MTDDPTAAERGDILEALGKHRYLFRYTVEQLTDEQASSTPTASELSLGGLIKHVASTEQEWARFIVDGPQKGPDLDWDDIDWSNPPPEVLAYQNGFRMVEGETLAGLARPVRRDRRRDRRARKTVDLDARHELPAAPWFDEGATWSNRRVFTHIVAETAQHAGHADIIRETIDGQKSMG